MSNEEKTYVLGEVEVKMTGRTASRTVGNQTITMVEVTPKDPDNGTWKKWVVEGQLFKIN